MAEKEGNTVKMQYDFNTSGELEVCIKGEWYRTTSREFRSFDGKRRLTEPTVTEHGNVIVPMTTYEYNGPVYMFGTNNEVEPMNEEKIITSAYWEDAGKRATDR